MSSFIKLDPYTPTPPLNVTILKFDENNNIKENIS